MFKDKRGQGLSMNIVVIAILAVLILVIIAIIFTGGVGNVYRRMGEFFQIGTKGQTLEFIRQQCNIACSTARTLDDPSKSPYCNQIFKYDETGTGKEIVDVHCYDSLVNAPCASIDEGVCKGASVA